MKYGNYPKAYSFKRINSKSKSKGILINSLRFLLEGIQQIDTNPRQSIVSFWTGVELFIKSLLIEEHWSLIVKDTKNIDHENFENGDFVSIDFQHSISLIENIFNVTLDKKTRTAFDMLRKHRNKIIHFTNPQITNKTAFELCDIFVEMGNVWDELQGLMLPAIDIEGTNEIPNLYNKITTAIDSHKVILEGKYQHVYEIKLRHLKSDDILTCESCNYKAVVLSPVNSILYQTKCLVCNNETDSLRVNCKNCNNVNYLAKSNTACSSCHEQIDAISYMICNDDINSRHPTATCHRCGCKSVVNIESIWFCLDCFSYHTVSVCDRCGSSVTHSTRTSHLDGCICCEGSMQ